VEQRQSHYSTVVAQCISTCRTGTPLRIELQLLQFRNRRGALRVFLYFSFLPAAFFGAPPPMKDIVRHKALQSCPAQRKKLLQQRASKAICEGVLWASLADDRGVVWRAEFAFFQLRLHARRARQGRRRAT